jgi:hypothetical protein
MTPPAKSQSTHLAFSGLAGKPVTRAIADLVKEIPNIERVTFVAYRPAPGLDVRLNRATDPTVEIREEAELLREKYGIPFWDSILAISMKRGEIPERYVQLAILHDQSPDEYSIHMSRLEVVQDNIESKLERLPEGFVLAFSSKVVLEDGTQAHVPLMDFRCNPSPQNSSIVKKALAAMGERSGILAHSGRSYHFYGLRLLSEDAWRRFLAMGILFSPIVDARYIAHRLADGACRLRICAGSDKPSVPWVMEVFS